MLGRQKRPYTAYDMRREPSVIEDYNNCHTDYIPLPNETAARPMSRNASRMAVGTQTNGDLLPRVGHGEYGRFYTPVQQYEQRGSLTHDNLHGDRWQAIDDGYPIRRPRTAARMPSPPMYRQGRMGAQWKHIKSCIGNLGNHLCFIDGTVKQEENIVYPPYVWPTVQESHTYISSRLPVQRYAVPRYPNTKQYDNIYNEHAKNDFKYWYPEQKPIDLASRMRFAARKVELGY